MTHAARPSSCTAAATPRHDPVFDRFNRRRGLAPADRIVNFLGIMERREYLAVECDRVAPAMAAFEPDLPPFVESYFEWSALLRAVVDYAQTFATGQTQRAFTMIELGAGFGRWLANGAGAVRCYRHAAARRIDPPPPRLIAVEAEPQHFRWISEHLRDNGIAFDPADLHHAACAAKDGEVEFYCGASAAWWGQEVVRPGHRPIQTFEGQAVERLAVPALSLASLLPNLDHVHLIDADIQGAEAEVFTAAGDALNRCVERLIIATHNRDVEDRLRAFFDGERGWICEMDFTCRAVNDTPVGPIDFEDGLQVWRNARLTAERIA